MVQHHACHHPSQLLPIKQRIERRLHSRMTPRWTGYPKQEKTVDRIEKRMVALVSCRQLLSISNGVCTAQGKHSSFLRRLTALGNPALRHLHEHARQLLGVQQLLQGVKTLLVPEALQRDVRYIRDHQPEIVPLPATEASSGVCRT